MKLSDTLLLGRDDRQLSTGAGINTQTAQELADRLFENSASTGRLMAASPAAWRESWVVSKRFVLRTIHMNAVAAPKAVQPHGIYASQLTEEPIVVDLNKQKLGHTLKGIGPKVIVVYGAERFMNAMQRGDHKIKAWVGVDALAACGCDVAAGGPGSGPHQGSGAARTANRGFSESDLEKRGYTRQPHKLPEEGAVQYKHSSGHRVVVNDTEWKHFDRHGTPVAYGPHQQGQNSRMNKHLTKMHGGDDQVETNNLPYVMGGGPGSGPHHDIAKSYGFVKVGDTPSGGTKYHHPRSNSKLYIHKNNEWTHEPLHGINDYGKHAKKLESTLGRRYTKAVTAGGPGSGPRPNGLRRTADDESHAAAMDRHGDSLEKGGSASKIPTHHLRALHYYNMGQSGGGAHPKMQVIEKELSRRGLNPRPNDAEYKASLKKLGLDEND